MRALKRVIERGFVYRGLKPVYWCFDCGSSLAEFEIEYADKKSQTLDVGFLCAEPDKLAAAFGLPEIVGESFAVIWTTTAWTLPANQALNLNPALEYALVHTERGQLLLAASLVETCLARYGLQGHGGRDDAGRKARRHRASATRWRMSMPATTAWRRSTWPTTPRPKTAPASCTRRRPMASTTSTPAPRTA